MGFISCISGTKNVGALPNNKGETTVKVIGNVFDNPELAKEDKTENENILA